MNYVTWNRPYLNQSKEWSKAITMTTWNFPPWSMVSMVVFCDLISCPRPNLRLTILTRDNLHSNPGHGQNGHYWPNFAVIPFVYGKIGF